MPPSEPASTARRLWLLYEPIHAVTYFSDETTAAYKAVGLKGFWQGYFASRAAPMGPVGAEVCSATFYNFHPGMVTRALPSAWEATSPAAVLAARDEALAPLLTDLFGEHVGLVPEAADLALDAAAGCDVVGRALYAGHAAVSVPDDPVLRLWWATTLLREHRGDGHVAALVANGIDGVEAHVLLVAAGLATKERMQGARSWGDDDWAAAHARLADRGLVDDAGLITDAGRALRGRIESTTDELANAPWERVGPERTERLAQLLAPLRRQVLASGRIPGGNPIGLPVDA